MYVEVYLHACVDARLLVRRMHGFEFAIFVFDLSLLLVFLFLFLFEIRGV